MSHFTIKTRVKSLQDHWAPFSIVLIYLVIGLLWIIFSDQAVPYLIRDPHKYTYLHTTKGCFYVIATAILLYVLIQRKLMQIRRSEDSLRAIIESMNDAVFITDAHGQIVDCNTATMKLFKIGAKEEWVGMPSNFFASRDLTFIDSEGTPLPSEANSLFKMARGEQIRGREGLVCFPDGREIMISVSASPVLALDKDKKVVNRTVYVLRDITELRRLSKLREDFISTAAHELKTPIAAIKGYVQLLHKWAPGGHNAQEGMAFTVINRQCDRINRLVQELLEVSRLQLGRLELQLQYFDLGELLDNVVQEMESLSSHHRLVIKENQSITVRADKDRINQVIVNLLDNAIKFSPQGGTIVTSITSQDNMVTCSIADPGVGIPSDKQPHVFDRYFRAHTDTDQDYGGMGMGLFISRQIIDKHGGKIWLESDPGRGATFYFELPRAEKKTDACSA